MEVDFEVGKEYLVYCAELRMKLDDKIFLVPVFNHLHADPQFGFKDQHYHIDARFYIEPRLLHQFGIKHGQTSAVIVPVGSVSYTLLGIKLHHLPYIGHETGLAIPTVNEIDKAEKRLQYFAWYKTFIGKECQGKRCPHLGTPMLQKNGLLICPMHNLIADLNTLKIIELS